jgi:hypothetical protein
MIFVKGWGTRKVPVFRQEVIFLCSNSSRLIGRVFD